MDLHKEEDVFQEAYDEAFDLRGSKEEERRKAVIIPCTQQEEIQKTVEKRRGRSKGVPKKDIEDNREVMESVPDSQPTAMKRTRTVTERRPTKKASKAIQEKEEGSCYSALLWLQNAMTQQTETIQAMKEEIKALGELPQTIKSLQKELADLKAAQIKFHDESRKAVSEQTDILHTGNIKIQDIIERAQPSYAAVTSIPPISRVPLPAHTDTLVCTIDTVGTREQD